MGERERERERELEWIVHTERERVRMDCTYRERERVGRIQIKKEIVIVSLCAQLDSMREGEGDISSMKE